MGEYSTIRVKHEGPVDWLTLDRPDRLNALDATMVRELWEYFDQLQSDYSRRVVILRGSGRGFCAGLDLHWHATATEGMPKGATEAGPGPSLPDIILKMRSSPQIIVALVHGAACGGGFAFVLASDIRIAGRSARMNAAFVKLGLSGCELGTSYFLPRLVGAATTAELLMTGRFIHADRALATGLVSELVDDDELENTARRLVDDLLAASPMGLRKTQETLQRTASIDDLAAVIALEERVQMACIDAGHFAPSLKPREAPGR